jgi:hypothetical protein
MEKSGKCGPFSMFVIRTSDPLLINLFPMARALALVSFSRRTACNPCTCGEPPKQKKKKKKEEKRAIAKTQKSESGRQVASKMGEVQRTSSGGATFFRCPFGFMHALLHLVYYFSFFFSFFWPPQARRAMAFGAQQQPCMFDKLNPFEFLCSVTFRALPNLTNVAFLVFLSFLFFFHSIFLSHFFFLPLFFFQSCDNECAPCAESPSYIKGNGFMSVGRGTKKGKKVERQVNP